MIYVFIDTNVFLNFYDFDKDHLDKLEKIADLNKKGKIKLILTQQVVDEFNRNRENKLKNTFECLNKFHLKLTVPNTCHDIDEMKEIQKGINSLIESTKKLEKRLREETEQRKLYADKQIQEIFSSNKPIEITDDILKKAKRRFDLGNPPGKRGSYGDAINWECILDAVPDDNDLFLIASDKDFPSVINPKKISDFLNDEWKKKKKSNIIFHNLISEFLQDKFPEVNITPEDIREEEKAVLTTALATKSVERYMRILGSLAERIQTIPVSTMNTGLLALVESVEKSTRGFGSLAERIQTIPVITDTIMPVEVKETSEEDK